MRSPAQSVTWEFPLAGGMALPKDREEHPDSFVIPTGSTTLYPVRKGANTYYFSYRTTGDEAKYHLSPRVGSPQKSIQVGTSEAENDLLVGLSINLPGRVNAMTLFSRIMTLPEHLHSRAIEHISRQKPIGFYADAADLCNALSSMLSTMGPQIVKDLAVSQMVYEITRTNYERRPALTCDYRKRYPEPWVEEAKLKAVAAKPKPRPPLQTVETEFNFGFD